MKLFRYNLACFIGLLVLFQITSHQARAQRSDIAVPTVKKVLVLEFNPIIESLGNNKLTQVRNWHDPLTLESLYISDIRESSDRILNYQIVERQVIDDIPVKNDSFD
ncbi:MAG: hypothetical protein AAB874_06120 [Patescibacteria group bacterium]